MYETGSNVPSISFLSLDSRDVQGTKSQPCVHLPKKSRYFPGILKTRGDLLWRNRLLKGGALRVLLETLLSEQDNFEVVYFAF
jgi:hypothetical protein